MITRTRVVFVALLLSTVAIVAIQFLRVSLSDPPLRGLQIRQELTVNPVLQQTPEKGKKQPPQPDGGNATTLEELTELLQQKLSLVKYEKVGFTKLPCKRIRFAGQPCVNSECPAKFSPSPRERLRQILATRNDSLASIKDIMAPVTRPVPASKYLFISAVSDNHYPEMQAMVKSLHEHVFSRLQNFTFVMFDIGLSPHKRNMTEKKCKCTVLDFPFDNLPKFFTDLRCYTWKPTVVWSLIEKAEFVVWMDAAVRWYADTPLDRIFQRVSERGVQIVFSTGGSIAMRTDNATFRFYGDLPCQYEPFGEATATYIILHNDPFVRRAVLDPWMSCALTRDCLCVQNHRYKTNCRRAGAFPKRTGQCHRFDQSALGIILAKLFGERINLLRVPPGIGTKRRQHSDWFEETG